jgi:hypothetical protein
LPLIVRLALLPVLGIPEPRVADEFGYLLLADKCASGRLTNSTHPFWRHFEAVYTFHQPTYTSIYPVAPALLLALAKWLGVHPWLGVWFGAGLMCHDQLDAAGLAAGLNGPCSAACWRSAALPSPVRG